MPDRPQVYQESLSAPIATCTGAPAWSEATGSSPLGACASQPLYQSSGIGRVFASSVPGFSQRSACRAWAPRSVCLALVM